MNCNFYLRANSEGLLITNFIKKKLVDCINGWIGDGICDDVNNIGDCLFDGGDCCNQPLVTNYCTECECHGKFVN